MRSSPVSALLFDLDGTLVDTAPDLIAAVHATLAQNAIESAVDYAALRAQASNGSLAMLRAAVPHADEPRLESLREVMLQHYQLINGTEATLFDGLAELLSIAKTYSIAIGVVTNKPAIFTKPLLSRLGLLDQLQSVISADTTRFRKPHPAPMLLAAQQLQTHPDNILYVGDAERDIIAAKAANMPSAAALWGYINTNDNPQLWHADMMLQHPTHLTAILTGDSVIDR
ncbi:MULTISPECIES: HAD family hydrolase [Shewanella]|uniref:HAD family hydrolase n=1 Tax=Shewanella TaxID=22 RepID=UPI0016765BEA|nr:MULTISPECIES: HAD-IA family hydrolase [Shewanella]MBO1270285.1 HAD-IA family hydrolase [Shewanella sp. 4t3-1-2LB]MCL2905575.1 HAD-IA family hydrolase [Shewanella fodinae]GGY92121.1 haloacid dehalogenase [Shewanella fodinae]